MPRRVELDGDSYLQRFRVPAECDEGEFPANREGLEHAPRAELVVGE